LAAVLSRNVSSACVPTSLVSSTIKAPTTVAAGHWAAAGVVSHRAATPTEGVLKAMQIKKLKTGAMLTLMSVVTLTGAVLAYGGGGDKPAPTGGWFGILARAPVGPGVDPPPADRGPNATEASRADFEQLRGRWVVTACEADGKPLPQDKDKELKLVIGSDWLRYRYVNKPDMDGPSYRLELDATTDPKRWTMKDPAAEGGGKLKVSPDALGIYALDGDTLRVCFTDGMGRGDPTRRPAEFATTPASGRVLLTLKRETSARTHRASLVRVVYAKPAEWLVVIGGAAFRSVDELKRFVGTLPEGSVVEWQPAGKSIRDDADPKPPLSSAEELAAFRDHCRARGVDFVLIPGK
jgi:uncharacterized protein (TIGR03067 family)